MIKSRQINISLILFLPSIPSACLKAVGPEGRPLIQSKDNLLYGCNRFVFLCLFDYSLLWLTGMKSIINASM